MNKIVNIIFLLLLTHICWAQSSEDYNPQNHADPDAYYSLTVEASPLVGGSVSPSGKRQLTEGSKVSCSATANLGYRFKCWMVGDEVVSTDSRFTYTMPEENVILIAYFDWVGNEDYDPTNPSDPSADGYYHKVTLYASPSVGGYFSNNSFNVKENESAKVYAYPYANYRFVGWMQDGEMVSTSNPMEITMGTHNLSYTALFEYDPTNPVNPNANKFYPETGELVIDDFTPGYLNSAISAALGSNPYSSVKSVIIIGQMSAGDLGFAKKMTQCTYIDLSRTNGYTEIPAYAFENMKSLETVKLPSCVESIGTRAFGGCTGLKELYCDASVPPTVGTSAFYNVPDSLNVHVPAGTKELYAAADGWNELGKIEEEEVLVDYDVNMDGKVNVGDISGTVCLITGIGGDYSAKAADANGDGEINVADISVIADYIMNEATYDARKVQNLNLANPVLSMPDFTMAPNGVIDVPVCLSMTGKKIASVQFDIVLPEGVSVKDNRIVSTDASHSHSLVAVRQKDDAVRVVDYSVTNTNFVNNDIINITLNVSNLAPGVYPVHLKNIVMATADGESIKAEATALMTYGDATGIATLETVNTNNAKIYDINGSKLEKANRGIVIVNGRKVRTEK